MSERMGRYLGPLPTALLAAHSEVGRWSAVAVGGAWRSVRVPGSTCWGLPVRLTRADGDAEHIGAESDWMVCYHPETRRVRVYPAQTDRAVTATFGHQEHNGIADRRWDVRSGYLCTVSSTHLLAKRRAAAYDEPSDVYERVLWHVQQALVWIEQAGDGMLTRGGDPFELPDYKTGGEASGTLAVSESGRTLNVWKDAPRVGTADLISVGPGGVGVVQRWRDADGSVVHEPEWGRYIAGREDSGVALWVRFDVLPVVAPWQAPRVGGELQALARAQGLDLRSLLEPLWQQAERTKTGLLLIGAPIPERFGGADVVMHWQALRITRGNARKGRSRQNQKMRADATFAATLGSGRALDWVTATQNWHPDVLGGRGHLTSDLRNQKVVLIGAGALGSEVADMLVRMGLDKLTLVDDDRYEAANGVRHRLGLRHIGGRKAPLLADELNASVPSAQVAGFAERVPSANADVQKALAEADVVIDCTASDRLMEALPDLGLRQDCLVVSASVGLHASRLFAYADAAPAFDAEEFGRWFAPYRAAEHAEAQRIGLPQAAGCWHPVTPVPLHRLKQQAGRFVEHVEEVLSAGVIRSREVFDLPQRGALARRAA